MYKFMYPVTNGCGVKESARPRRHVLRRHCLSLHRTGVPKLFVPPCPPPPLPKSARMHAGEPTRALGAAAAVCSMFSADDHVAQG
jgi:hypothetical protein